MSSVRQAGCLYGPVGTSGPKTRVTVSSPACSEKSPANRNRTARRTRIAIEFIEWTLGEERANSQQFVCEGPFWVTVPMRGKDFISVALTHDQPRPGPAHWRKWLRISTRGLIVLVLLIAVGLGWLVNSAHKQRDAVAAIRKGGGDVIYNYERSLSGQSRWPKWLVDRIGIDSVENVCSVTLSRVGSDADMVQVGHLKRLEELSLFRSAVTDQGLRHLEGLNNLRFVGLGDTKVTGAGVAHLGKLGSLAGLYLNATNVSDDGMKELCGMTNLRVLSLDRTRVGDAGVVHLKGMKSLQRLGLEGTEVTDAGLVQLKGLSGLHVLGLAGTKVTDAGLVQLKGLSGLQYLNVAGTKVSAVGVQELKRSLPMTQIYHGDFYQR